MSVSDKLSIVRNNIHAACICSGRAVSDVSLIAVSKTKPVEDILSAYSIGHRDFGENHVKELAEKYNQLPNDIRWHMIGHLQTNKVRQIINKTVLIHSIDSVHLADAIDSEASKCGIQVDGLLEINMSGEESKYGFSPSQLQDILSHAGLYKNLRLKGLMTVAPYVENPEDNRTIFRKMKALSVDIKAKNYDNICMEILSMGMTGDYCVAIEEGATHVRVGTGIFGSR